MNQDEKKRQVAEAALDEVRHLLDPRLRLVSVPAQRLIALSTYSLKAKYKSSVQLPRPR